MASATGTYIVEDAWYGSTAMSDGKDKHAWPGTYKPTGREWDLWRSMLTQCFIIPHNSHRRLKEKLGAWTTQRDKWKWWITKCRQMVWEKVEDGWKVWSAATEDVRCKRFINPIQLDNIRYQVLPEDAVRVDTRSSCNGRGIMIVGTESEVAGMDAPTTRESLYDVLKTLPVTAHWAIQQAITTDNGNTIAQALVEGVAVCVSDGSLKNGLGTAAFTIEAQTSVHRIHGVNKVPGPIGDGDSYRCELAGLYAMVLIINTVAQYYHIPWGKCTIACDNESSLKVFNDDFVPSPTGASFDLVSALWNVLQKSPISWSAVHVKGHQDTKGKKLTRLELMNVQMDHTAKAYWQHLVREESATMTPQVHEIYQEGWCLWDADEKLVQPSRNILYERLYDPTTIDYWIQHDRMSAVAADLIDWHGNGRALRKTPIGLRRWTTKHASHNCGCGKTLVEWGKQDDDCCPRCSEAEDTDHVLKCNAKGAGKVWKTSMEELEEKLIKLKTDPAIARMILVHLHAWRHDIELSIIEGEEKISQALSEQSTIGWRNMLEGLWSKKWSVLQQRYYRKIESRKTGKKWMETVSQELRIVAFKQWEHRNDIKHASERPRHKRYEEEMNRQIRDELVTGPGNLPLCVRHKFIYTYKQLEERTVKFRQAWLVNITSARQREERKRLRDEEAECISRKRSRLLRWIQSGRAT